MTNIFENSLKLIDETLNNMYLKEDEEERFVSVANQDNSFDPSNPGSKFYTDHEEFDVDKEEEKRELTSEVMDKIKQSLKVSDELQSILNRIKKINDDIDTNDWKVNEEDNTAILRSKNARIFKQNENLCLSHDGKIEIFKSVAELHDWLKKNNYPLPKGIVLHESVLNEENINRTPGWKEIKDLTDQNEKLQQQLNASGQELKVFTNEMNNLVKKIEKANAAINGTSDILAFIPWPEIIVQKLGRELRPGEEEKILERKKEAETEYVEALNELKELINKNSGYESIEQLKSAKSEAFKALNKMMNFCGEILKDDPTNKDALKALDNQTKYLVKTYYDNFALPNEKKNFEYEQIKKQIDDNKQKILDIYKKYNAEPGSWDPNYSEIEIPEADYSVPEEEQIWDDNVTEEKIEKLDVPEITDDVEDNIALRTKARYANTKWGPILKHRWDRLGNRESWTPEDIQKHKEEYMSRMNPNARGMAWEQEKAARKLNDIRYEKNPNINDANKDFAPKMVWNDLNKGKDFSTTKKESTKDNQITDNEIWYLEYQTDDVDNNHYLNSNWRDEDLISDNLETAAKFTSREDAINELQELYSVKKLPFPLKPITGLNMNECGVTCAGLGSAVQYVGNKKKEESLEESRRSDGYGYGTTRRNSKNSAEVLDLQGNHLGKIGKTPAEYEDDENSGFSYDENSSSSIYQDPTRGIKFRFTGQNVYKKIVLDDNDRPIGYVTNNGKVYNLKDNTQIGIVDEGNYVANMTSEERQQSRKELEAHYKGVIDSRAGDMWRGQKDAPKLFNKKTGNILPSTQAIWQTEPFVSNEALQRDPSLMYAFAGYDENDRPAIENRINEINNAFGLNLTPNEPVVKTKPGTKNKPASQNRIEFEKWRDTYFIPFFYKWRTIDSKTREMLTNDEVYNAAHEKVLANKKSMDSFDQNEINIANKKTNEIINSFNNGEITGTKNLVNTIKNEILTKNIPNNIKKNIISKVAIAASEYFGDDAMEDYVNMQLMPLINQQNESVSFNKYLLSLLTEAPTPADFADGAANVASDMASATTGANDASTTNLDTQDNITSDGLDDYGPEEPGMDGGLPSFGDININGGSGSMDDEAPMPSTKNERIVDVLVNENDMSQMKVKVKDLDTGKIEIRDLNEVDI